MSRQTARLIACMTASVLVGLTVVSRLDRVYAADDEPMELAPAEPAGGLEIEITTTKEEFQPLEPITLRIVTRNISTAPIQVSVASPWLIYGFAVRRGEQEMPLTEYGRQRRKAADRRAFGWYVPTLVPGDHWTDNVLLNRGVDMTSSGTYLIRVTRAVFKLDSPKGKKKETTVTKSNQIRVVIRETAE